jgi:peptide/nickel transport system permease protein
MTGVLEATPVVTAAPALTRRRVLRRVLRNPLAMVGVVVVAVAVLAAILAPLVAPFSFDATDFSAPAPQPPSLAHWFGTDELGRDLLTRILFGARISLAVGLFSAAMSAAIGITIGAAAGYIGGWIDDVLMRVADAMLSVPRLPLLMIAAAVLEPSVPLLIALVGLAGWVETARVVRADVQSIRTRDYVTAARALGAGPMRVVVRHVLAGALPAATVATTIAVGRGILLESALSFFGVGVQPPTASWGNMLYQAQTTMTTAPWLGIFPGAFIFVTVLCCNILGDALGDRGRAPRNFS